MTKLILRSTRVNSNYYLNLTEEQYLLLDWLCAEGLLEDEWDIEIFEGYEFQEIQ